MRWLNNVIPFPVMGSRSFNDSNSYPQHISRLVDGKFNTTDGCTYIPDVLLNYESCVIHDLCYVTPGVTKTECDEVMKENINKIYCENVNM